MKLQQGKTTFSERMKRVRVEMALSQEAIGAQKFISTPGWIKIENGQRTASEELIDKLITFLVTDKYITKTASVKLRRELLYLKYLYDASPFVREAMIVAAKAEGWGDLCAPLPKPASKPAKKKGK